MLFTEKFLKTNDQIMNIVFYEVFQNTEYVIIIISRPTSYSMYYVITQMKIRKHL